MLPAEARTAAAAAAAARRRRWARSPTAWSSPSAADPLLVLTSGAHRVDESQVAALLGVERSPAPPAEFVRRHTGQAIGGVAPVGHPEPIGTLVDVELARYEQVWAAAGHPRAVFPTSYDELLRLTERHPRRGRQRPGRLAAPAPQRRCTR